MARYRALSSYVSASGHVYPAGSVVETDEPKLQPGQHPQHAAGATNLVRIADDAEVTKPHETQPGHPTHRNLNQREPYIGTETTLSVRGGMTHGAE